jgi:hypothetical protein
LRDILVISPSHNLAKSMLSSMEQTEALVEQRQIDPEVRQTRGGDAEMVKAPPDTLDGIVFERAQREMKISGYPEIFDLPRPLAIQRSQEFMRYIHPILQKKCARCHNGTYPGKFQLVPIRSKADASGDALRANLDAALSLVDRDNPARSELLSSTLRSHGSGPDRRPIFTGYNDTSYKVLSAWVQRVRPARSPVAAAPAPQPGGGVQASDEPFAVGRGRARARLGTNDSDPADMIPAMPNPARESRVTIPPTRYREGLGLVPEADDGPVDPKEFPLPYALTGVKPAMPGDKPVKPPVPAAPRGAAIPKPVLPKQSTSKSATTATTPAPADADDDEAELEKAIKALPKSSTKKPVNIDPDVLIKLLNRGPGQ